MAAKFYICLTKHVTCILEYVLLYDIILLSEEDEDKSIFIIII